MSPCIGSALHDAAAAGDSEVLGRLLAVLSAPLEELDPAVRDALLPMLAQF